MRDHLKEFIQDYNSGRISIVDLENRLSFDDWKNSKLNKKEHLYGDISEGALKMQIAYTSYMKIPKDPSDIIEQRFLSKERFRLILKLKRTIEKDDWDILKMIINGKKQVDIAKAKGISQGTVSNHLKK